ncbi:MAG TPA: carboxypeptidase-like regulatory domain-containing protein, partial [Candidatus Bathyarchaeia archaeon]
RATDSIYSGTSDSNGVARMNLEKGDHNVTAYWNGVRVGQIGISVTGESRYDLTCELTNLKITLQDTNGFLIPSVSLKISYQYTTTKDGASKTGSASGETDIRGNFYLNSSLPRIDYTVNASVYGRVFNGANNTFSNIPAVPTYNVIILFPNQNLTMTALDYDNNAIPNARITIGEVTSGIFYVASTNGEGLATVEVAFGVYQVRVYTENVLLNETVIEVFSNVETPIRCTLYNLPVSVLVVDYFGQPIPNVNVVYMGPDGTALSEKTQANGVAVFDKVIGGNAQIAAYPAGQEDYFEAVNLRVDSSTTVHVKMGRHILIGSFLIDIGIFITIILILVTIILFVVLEVYRRRKLKPVESKSNQKANAK